MIDTISTIRDRGAITPARSSAPLTYAQESLYFLDQLTKGLPVYHMPQVIRLRGPLNVAALENSLRCLVRRHEALRMQIHDGPEGPRQFPGSADDFCLMVHDFTARDVQMGICPEGTTEARSSAVPSGLFGPKSQPGVETPGYCQSSLRDGKNRSSSWISDSLEEEIQKRIARPFDLAGESPFRAELFRIAADDHILLIVLHHVVGDMSSLGILYHELNEAYRAFSENREPEFSPIEVQFSDFAGVQRAREISEETTKFWRERLKDCCGELEFPLDRARPRLPSFRGNAHYLEFSPDFTSQLSAFAKKSRCSLYMLCLAALEVLIYRYTGEERFAIGTPFTERDDERLENTVGYLINLLPIPCELRPNETFRELLARVRVTALEIYGHHQISFRKILEEVGLVAESPKPALARIVFQYFPELPALELTGLECVQLQMHWRTSKFDLCFSAFEQAGAITTEIEYDTDLFDAGRIERIGRHWRCLLQNIIAEPDEKIIALELMDARESALIESWNKTETVYPRDATVHALFEEQVRLHPTKTALLFQDSILTYEQLNNRAAEIAAYLEQSGVRHGDFVGVCLDRSPDLITALIGILKTGAAFVPLDANYPKPRLDYLFEDSGVRLLVTDSRHARIAREGTQTILLDEIAAARPSGALQPASTDVLQFSQTPVKHEGCSARGRACSQSSTEDIAYMMYTSGSTGNPKGATIPHRAIVRLVKNTNFASFSPEEVFLAFAPISFDASTLEIWGPLLNGGTLAIFPPQFESIEQFEEVLERHKVTTLWLTAGLFNTIVDRKVESLRGVRQLLVGGDVLSVAHIRKAQESLPNTALINGYGPTENTTFTCCFNIPRNWPANRSIPIGRPISNTKVYILDERLQRVPIGVPGDLYAAGDGLSLGYWKKPELTAAGFLSNPFDPSRNSKIYKTGDRARFLADGIVEFLGRRDCQVKIRGFRVELGEIEAAFRNIPSVQDAAVVPISDKSGGKILVGYIVPRPGFASEADQLLQQVSAVLPSHARPSRLVLLPALPLGPNGKVNRHALPAPDLSSENELEGASAFNPIEAKLVEIWRQILELPRLGIDDNFFQFGGESLRATRAVSQINAAFNCRLTLARLFEAPTVRQMARLVQTTLNDDPIAPLKTRSPIAANLPPSEVSELSEEDVDALLRQLLGHNESPSPA